MAQPNDVAHFRCGECEYTDPDWDALKAHVRQMHPLPPEQGTRAPLDMAGGYLRLPVYEILADHATCRRWAEMARSLRQGTRHLGNKAARDHRRVNDLMTPHKDVLEAALACVAGRGHH